jgi:hypothetical protein
MVALALFMLGLIGAGAGDVFGMFDAAWMLLSRRTVDSDLPVVNLVVVAVFLVAAWFGFCPSLKRRRH